MTSNKTLVIREINQSQNKKMLIIIRNKLVSDPRVFGEVD
jgi:hypothetical protein